MGPVESKRSIKAENCSQLWSAEDQNVAGFEDGRKQAKESRWPRT